MWGVGDQCGLFSWPEIFEIIKHKWHQFMSIPNIYIINTSSGKYIIFSKNYIRSETSRNIKWNNTIKIELLDKETIFGNKQNKIIDEIV